MTDATRTAVLDAAEAAFADVGVDHASLRAIMRDAGVNPAAVHYHYGSRDALAQAVLDRVLHPLQVRRLDLLDQLVTADGPPPAVRALIEALVRPDLEQAAALADRSPRGHRLLGAIYTRPSAFVGRLVERSFAPVADRFLPHLVAALPDLPAVELTWRVRWCVFGLLGSRLCDESLDLADERLERELDRIATALAAALAAPPPVAPAPPPPTAPPPTAPPPTAPPPTAQGAP